MKKKIYIVCPVRKRTRSETIRVNRYVGKLEAEGHEVRLPYRDTSQVDELGLRIVEDHEADIIWADEIHIFWGNEYSEGRLFDFAQTRMARKFMPEKKIILVNDADIEITRDKETGEIKKSYTNVLLGTHFGLTSASTGADLEEVKKTALQFFLGWKR